MPLLLRVFIILAVCSTARADAHTYPVKSINLASAAPIIWYTGFGPSDLASLPDDVGEAHLVYGIELSDGGVVACGKLYETAGGSYLDAIAIKFAHDGTPSWAWRSNISNTNEVCNGLAQLPDGDILIAGYKTTGANPIGCIMKVSLASGTAAWSTYAEFPSSSTGAYSALESVSVDASHGVLVPVRLCPLVRRRRFRKRPECRQDQEIENAEAKTTTRKSCSN